jgi:hypothetical protein
MPTVLPAHPPEVLENYCADRTLAGLKAPVEHARERCLGASNWAHPYRRRGTYR